MPDFIPVIVRVVVRLEHVAGCIVNANHGIMWSAVHADEKLTAFVELEAAIRAHGQLNMRREARSW